MPARPNQGVFEYNVMPSCVFGELWVLPLGSWLTLWGSTMHPKLPPPTSSLGSRPISVAAGLWADPLRPQFLQKVRMLSSASSCTCLSK